MRGLREQHSPAVAERQNTGEPVERRAEVIAIAQLGRSGMQRPIAAAFAVLRRNLDFWRLSYALRSQPAALASIGAELSGWIDAVRQTLEGYFRARGSAAPQIEAAILFALIDGISQHYALDPAHYPLDAVEAALIARYR